MPGTTITGDVGYTTGPAVAPAGVHTNYGSGAPYATAGIDQNSALSALNSQTCTFTFAPGAIDLATDTTHGPIGFYTPGVYCTSGAASIGTAGITLSGSGTYIFRIDGALTSVVNSHITLAGASSCDVFWTPTSATTLGANSTFVGTNIDTAGITLGSNVSWIGRALAFGGTVTTDVDDNITVSSCGVVPPVVPPASTLATLHIVKFVVNNSGGISTASNFNIHVKLSGVEVSGSPAVGVVAPGISYSLTAGTYVVSEDATTLPYAQSFSGACNSSGSVTLSVGNDVTCTVVNDDIEPVVVLPSSITVIKTVINDNSRTKTVADFPLFVNGTLVTSGVSKVFPVGTYVITEVSDSNYTRTFSGDCNVNGSLNLNAGNNKTCIITNNDIAPVVVPVVAPVAPKLPKTGFPDQEKDVMFPIVILSGLSLFSIFLYFVKKNKTA